MGRPWETMGAKASRRRTHHPTQVHTCGETMGENGKQWGTKGDKTSGRRRHHPTQAHMWGDNGTRRQEGGRTIQHRHTCAETMRDKTSGRQTQHPTQTHMWGRDSGGKVETRYRDGGHAGPTNKKETRRETLGGRQRETRPRRTP